MTLAQLDRHLSALGPLLLGYSGGVDSALLAVVARRALGPARMLAVIGRSASYPAVQYRQALALAHDFDVPLHELDTHELADDAYRANAPDRCYHCKSELWRQLRAEAARRGIPTIIDGTNAEDLGEHRPGLRAAEEHVVCSPLADLGWTKAMVRAAARELGIPIWDAPAAPCLSSRIAYGIEVTPARLAQVERAEALVRAVGVRGNLRVRHHDRRARIEVDPAERSLLEASWQQVERGLEALGFEAVTLDPRGYRRGALLPLADGA